MQSERVDDERVEVGDRVVDAVDQRSRALGLSVAAMIERIDRPPLADQAGGDLAVAPAVLARPMSDHDDGLRITVAEPGLAVDLQSADAGNDRVPPTAWPQAHAPSSAQ